MGMGRRRRELAALAELQRKVWGEAVRRRHLSDRRRSRARRFGFAVIGFGVTLITLGLLSPGAHATPPRPLHKITLCHRTDSYTNPYVVITVDVASTLFEGHDGHDGPVFFPPIAKHVKWGDIIPPFDFGGSARYAGKNWTDLGISIFNNHCTAPGSATTTLPTGTTVPHTTVPPTTNPSPSTTSEPSTSTSSPSASTTVPSASTSSSAPSPSTTAAGATSTTSTVPSSVTTAGELVTTTVPPGGETPTSSPSAISTFQVPTTGSTSPGGPLPRTGAGAIALVLAGVVCIGAGLGLTRRRPLA